MTKFFGIGNGTVVNGTRRQKIRPVTHLVYECTGEENPYEGREKRYFVDPHDAARLATARAFLDYEDEDDGLPPEPVIGDEVFDPTEPVVGLTEPQRVQDARIDYAGIAGPGIVANLLDADS